MELLCETCGLSKTAHGRLTHKFTPTYLGVDEARAKMDAFRESTYRELVRRVFELHQEPHTYAQIGKILSIDPFLVVQILNGNSENEVEPETSDLERELAVVLNKHSAENGSNTPDFILAEYLMGCLKAFNIANNSCRAYQGQEDLNGA